MFINNIETKPIGPKEADNRRQAIDIEQKEWYKNQLITYINASLSSGARVFKICKLSSAGIAMQHADISDFVLEIYAELWSSVQYRHILKGEYDYGYWEWEFEA